MGSASGTKRKAVGSRGGESGDHMRKVWLSPDEIYLFEFQVKTAERQVIAYSKLKEGKFLSRLSQILSSLLFIKSQLDQIDWEEICLKYENFKDQYVLLCSSCNNLVNQVNQMKCVQLNSTPTFHLPEEKSQSGSLQKPDLVLAEEIYQEYCQMDIKFLCDVYYTIFGKRAKFTPKDYLYLDHQVVKVDSSVRRVSSSGSVNTTQASSANLENNMKKRYQCYSFIKTIQTFPLITLDSVHLKNIPITNKTIKKFFNSCFSTKTILNKLNLSFGHKLTDISKYMPQITRMSHKVKEAITLINFKLTTNQFLRLMVSYKHCTHILLYSCSLPLTVAPKLSFLEGTSIKYLCLKDCGIPSRTNWENNPQYFVNLFKAIGNSGLKKSIEKIYLGNCGLRQGFVEQVMQTNQLQIVELAVKFIC
ncbi:unnamed protein product [Moneuplotes crassus]|uniref:Uncharacterized protein n=1 Tax=Euplotes crassus TaxID=5936 RepID=A0AAD1U2Z0_EUPCR|nr:unnamed protein product [Moneuplotes crassus]